MHESDARPPAQGAPGARLSERLRQAAAGGRATRSRAGEPPPACPAWPRRGRHLDPALDQPGSRLDGEVRMVVVGHQVALKVDVPAGADEHRIARLGVRQARLQVYRRYLLVSSPTDLPADGRAADSGEVDLVDAAAAGDEVARCVDVGAGVDGCRDAGHVHTAVFVANAAFDADRRKELLREHTVAVRLREVEQLQGTHLQKLGILQTVTGQRRPVAGPPAW